jgi:hypothetical protein
MIALTLVVVDNVLIQPLVMVGKTAVMIRRIVPTPWRLKNQQDKGKGKISKQTILLQVVHKENRIARVQRESKQLE